MITFVCKFYQYVCFAGSYHDSLWREGQRFRTDVCGGVT